MIRGITYGAVLMMGLAAHAAQADVTVQERILQKGMYVKTDCETDANQDYDECKCDADIRYPQLGGLTNNEGEIAINSGFKKAAEQAQCEGTEVKEKPTAKGNGGKQELSPSSSSHHYEITFQSSHVLGLEFTDWGYTGGAHGNGSVDGVIVDLDKGKLITAEDLFAAKDLPAVNQAIYDVLSAKPEEEVFHDQIESKKGAFLVDGQCQGCTLVLSKDGLKVVFQTYEVAPYAAGNTEVLIPANLVSYPAVIKALNDAKNSPPTQKK